MIFSGSLIHGLRNSCNISCAFPHVACPSSSFPHVHVWNCFIKLTIGSYICMRLHHVVVKYLKIRYHVQCESSDAIKKEKTNTTSNTRTCFTTLIRNWAHCQLWPTSQVGKWFCEMCQIRFISAMYFHCCCKCKLAPKEHVYNSNSECVYVWCVNQSSNLWVKRSSYNRHAKQHWTRWNNCNGVC